MIKPRWKKVWTDLWMNKARTALVVLSIFIGVFATGVINGSRFIVVNELRESYLKTKPAHSTIFVSDSDSFGDDMIETIRKIDGVEEAEGRRATSVKLQVMPGSWEDLSLTAIPDFDDIQINQIRPVQGTTKPRDKEVLLERSSMEELHAKVGDQIVIERSDGKQKIMQITGVVHDLAVQPTSMSGRYYGYVTTGTMEWLGQKTDYTRVLLRVASQQAIAGMPAKSGETASNAQDAQANTQATSGGRPGRMRGGMPADNNSPSMRQIMSVTEAVYDKLKKSGRDPQAPRGPHGRPSNDHWATTFINNLSTMMSFLGVLSLFLSGFLVTNTISALLAQQVRQIGIMKAIGARSLQMMGMYMVLVLGFGILSLLLSVPLTIYVTDIFVTYVADFFNFDLSAARFPMNVIIIQAFASLAVPILAAILPVLLGTRVTILNALHSDSIQKPIKKNKKKKNKAPKAAQPGIISRLLAKILNRPLLLAIRNTFRRKARVTLTLLTLTVGGFIFIGIFTIRNSLVQTLDDLIANQFQFDMVVIFERSYRDYYLIDAIMSIPGITSAEAWSEGSGAIVYDDDTESDDISLTALPPKTKMMNPTVIGGRWLVPEDQNALVITNGVLEDDPDIKVGDSLTLKINERDTTWQVIGIATGIGTSREAYVNYDYFLRVIGEVGKTSVLRVQTQEKTVQYHTAMSERIEETLGYQGIGISRIFYMTDMRERVVQQFDFIVGALMIMALLMAVVGGLGLAGTMSLNVIERTKEIGIMRAIGASTTTMIQIFMGEGLLIGLISWFIGTSLSLPMSKLLSDFMGNMFFRTPLSFNFSLVGVAVWLVFSVVIAVFSSFVPAWNASRVPVRDVLAYE